MIKSWANSRSDRFYQESKISKFRGLDIDAADELLAALDAATSLKDLGHRTFVWVITTCGTPRLTWEASYAIL